MQERFETFTVLINRISRDIRRIKNQEMAAYHLRSAHVSCLYYIYSLDGVTCGGAVRALRGGQGDHFPCVGASGK